VKETLYFEWTFSRENNLNVVKGPPTADTMCHFFIRMSFQQIVACTLFFVANVISVSNMAYSHSYLAIGGVQ